MGKLRPFVRKDSYMPNKKWIPFVIGNGYTTTDGASGPAPEYETVTGNPVSFNAITPFPLKQLSVAFSPVQSGSGDPSPDNVRPISGWDSLNVEQRGENLFDPSKAETGKWLNLTTGEIEPAAGYAVSDYIFVKAGQAYTITQPNSIRRWFYDLSKNPLSLMENVTTFTPTQDCYIRITLGTNLTPVDTYMVVMGNSLPAEYVPYNPSSRSISISLGSTVYSGILDVVTGQGEITMASVDLGALTWLVNSETANIFMAKVNGMAINSDSESRNTGFVISAYKPSSNVSISGNMNDKAALRNGGYIFVRDTAYSVKDVFAASVSGVQLVYELATPQTIQLTPQEVESLAGDNTMWSNANGDLTVEYRSN